MTKTFTMSEIDAAQIGAILSTHSEMQDARVGETLSMIGHLNCTRSNDDEVDRLTGLVTVLEQDSDNLKRLAHLFK
jgi:hypothetical protein